MRAVALLFLILVLAVTGAASHWIGSRATDWVEARTTQEVGQALDDAAQDWARVGADGLRVYLGGVAPDEASRMRALEVAAALVSGKRLEDRMSVAERAEPEEPPFALQILRNEGRINLIGLVPLEAGREPIMAALSRIPGRVELTDLLETRDYRVPEGWTEGLEYGLRAIARLTRAKLSVAPGAVTVTAVLDTAELREETEKDLRDDVPEGIALTLDLSSPRPVVAPYALDFTLKDGKAEMARCVAPDEEGRTTILGAASAAGIGEADCQIALGAPSAAWPEAASRGIGAVVALGGGELRMRDTDIRLKALASVEADAFEEERSKLKESLPAPYSLDAIRPQPPQAGSENPLAPPAFRAALTRDGKLAIEGDAGGEREREAIINYAAAAFGKGQVKADLTLREELPAGWPARLIASIDALSRLGEGEVRIDEEGVSISGRGGSETISQDVVDIFASRAPGTELETDLRYDEKLRNVVSGLEAGECEARVATLLDTTQIAFEPSSADIDPDSQAIIEEIVGILTRCPGTRFEIEGHTDSQGSEEFNLRLSQARANSVLSALLEHDLPLEGLTAKGYGESEPIADNGTEEGRMRNRRISFRLLAAKNVTDTSGTVETNDGAPAKP